MGFVIVFKNLVQRSSFYRKGSPALMHLLFPTLFLVRPYTTPRVTLKLPGGA